MRVVVTVSVLAVLCCVGALSGEDAPTEYKLTASDAAAGDYFGVSVSVSRDTAVIGAWGDDAGMGSAYVFTRTAGVWTEQAKLTASDMAAGDTFGESVSVSGDTALIGADADDDGGSASGSAYVFSGFAGVLFFDGFESGGLGEWSLAVGQTPMMVGDWYLYYDWGCGGSVSCTSYIEFFEDGTFEDDDGAGTWMQEGLNVSWTYGTAEYTGIIEGAIMQGTMADSPAGSTGCWTANHDPPWGEPLTCPPSSYHE
jgi:hypothetical protein